MAYLQSSQCVLWYLWKWRCNKVFDPNASTPQSPHLIINMFAKDWLTANFADPSRDVALLPITWLEPNENWVKLNIDRSRNSESGIITAGGVLCNHWKSWLKGFVLNKGIGSVIEAELWAFMKALRWLGSLAIGKHNHPLYSLILNCKNLVEADWNCSITHIFREGNMLVDGLARMGHRLNIGIKFFEEPPSKICPIFDADYRGVTCLRQCPVSYPA
ncbi:hypothetical protein Dsin_021454 [Dipteronia sinensis]|uniref:RNase H type-1 domain-containing protein n=1 Tax=Dipteronia sinensis TaxID=43782 RepID=A0AAE0DZ44_9ROSI|nr:hypothetical protein Dsin_021454 [Dipteronia sinensis]